VAKLHYLKFYPESWIAEIGLRMCSLAARGLWIDLICHMAKSPEHGVLLTMAGKPITDGQVAAFVGIEPNTVLDALKELEENKVLSRRPDGAIFSRRMVKDHAEYLTQSESGKKGAKNRYNKGGLSGTPWGTPSATPLGTPSHSVGYRVLGSSVSSSSSPEEAPPEQVAGSATVFLADRAIRTGDVPPGFARFVASYPPGRSKDRPAVLAAWMGSECEKAAESILAGLERWKACDEWQSGYADNAEKFIRCRLWEQDPPVSKKQAGPTGHITAEQAVAQYRAHRAAKAAKEGA